MKSRALQVIDDQDKGTVLDLKIEVVRDRDGKIVQGITIGNTLHQNQAFLLMGHPGDFKYMPYLGIGFTDNLLGSELLEYRHRIREQFALDDLAIRSLQLYPSLPFKIDADYDS